MSLPAIFIFCSYVWYAMKNDFAHLGSSREGQDLNAEW